jgi:hypothetical protein
MTEWRRWHEPDCPCCECSHCFHVTGCCADQQGATVRVYETSAPGVTLATGTTDANGLVCFELGEHQGKALSYSITADDFTTVTGTLSLVCDGTTAVTLGPKVEAGGVSGKLTVTLVDEDGFPVTSGTAYVVDPANPLSFVASATMGPGGVVTFTGLAVPDTYFFRGPNLQNFPEFTLTCEGVADAKYAYLGEGQEWTFTGISCSSISWLCCLECGNPLPPTLCLSDPAGPTLSGSVPFRVEISCDVDAFEIELRGTAGFTACSATWAVALTNADFYGGSPAGSFQVARYTMVCGPHPLSPFTPGLYLQVERFFYCAETGYYGAGGYCTKTVTSPWVEATAITCDPFVATFDMPSYEIDCYTTPPPTLAGTRFYNTRPITVSLCA